MADIRKEKMGFGCFFPGTAKEEVTKVLLKAMECNYRFFDTASFYETERALGEAIELSGIARDELVIQTKLWIDERGYKNAKEACYRSLDRLKLDYLDSYLIHWPKSSPNDDSFQKVNYETMRAMEELQKEGVVKNIGLSNFLPHHIDALKEYKSIASVDQLELHPGYFQEEAVRKALDEKMIVQAWSPLGRGAVMENELLKRLALQYEKSVSQICLNYLLQKGVVPIVKSSSEKRMKENLEAMDFVIADVNIREIDTMETTGWSGEHPDTNIPPLKSNFLQ